MTNGGPWHNTPANQNTPRRRIVLWAGLMLLVVLGLIALNRFFPDAMTQSIDKANLLYFLLILGVVSASIVFSARRADFKTGLRNILLWSGIFLVLAIGFAYQTELQTVGQRLRAELIPGYAVQTDRQILVLTESANGNFYVYGAVNDVPVKFLIDTGASDIVLSPDDATRLGIDLKTLNFDRPYQTANGMVYGASTTVPRLTIGQIELFNVHVSVNAAAMGNSLLGMTFLKRMAAVEITGRQMRLHWKR